MSDFPPFYPVRVEAEYPDRPTRLLALLGLLFMFPKTILLVPHLFVLWFVHLAAMIAVYVGYLVVLITGEYPRGLFDFVLGALRWQTRVAAWLFGLVDRYPPFSMR